MNSKYTFRQAAIEDLDSIWEIINFAIQSRKKDGSDQWQDGYPNKDIIKQDLIQNYGYVLCEKDEILFYAALIDGIEPAYEALENGWLTNRTPYAVVHRLASSPNASGKGLSKIMMSHLEEKASNNGFYSIRIDTNFDNVAMLHILKKRGYVFCGIVHFRGSERKAFEKIICKNS